MEGGDGGVQRETREERVLACKVSSGILGKQQAVLETSEEALSYPVEK